MKIATLKSGAEVFGYQGKAESVFDTKGLKTPANKIAQLKEAHPELMWFRGMASHLSQDRDKELVLPKAFEKDIPRFIAHGAVTLGHCFDATQAVNIGRVTYQEVRPEGIYSEGYISTNSKAQDIRTNLKEEVPMDFSVSFIPKERRAPSEQELKDFGMDTRSVVTELEQLPLGIVNVGSNRNTRPEMVALSLIGKAAPEVIQGINERLAAIGTMAGEIAELISQLQGNQEPDPNNPEGPGQPPAQEQSLSVASAAAVKELIERMGGFNPRAGD